ncbi:MAG: aminotransferase class III-fold pyridoxal phosphate-dependent enzyme [Rhodospirillales bacterium]|nr:aminotransferase class III-fold pyridoxal phosphate-dependent enzyme [Rhodospirillales bacterium]
MNQSDYYEIAERTLPGAGLGGYALAEDVRFVIESGAGSRVRSVEGREYIDYVGGAGAHLLGHCHPALVEAVKKQAERGMHYFGTLNDTAIELSERLVDAIPCAEKIAYATTGSEATMYAMRMARAFTGRNKILKFEGAYHGNHDYSMYSVFPTKQENYPVAAVNTGGVPEQVQSSVLVAPYNDLETVRSIVSHHADDLAVIVVECLQRIIMVDPEFLRGLRALCDEKNVLLMFDEVVTGFRVAWGGAQELHGVIPDLATYGKVIGAGGPLACVAGRADILEGANPAKKGQPDYAYMNGTLHGNPIAAAATMASLDIISEPGFFETLHDNSTRFLAGMQEVLNRHGVPALAAGDKSFWQFLFMGKLPTTQVDMMNSDLAAMRKLDTEMLRRGIYVLPGVRRFVSAVHTEEDFARTIETLDEVCKAL